MKAFTLFRLRRARGLVQSLRPPDRLSATGHRQWVTAHLALAVLVCLGFVTHAAEPIEEVFKRALFEEEGNRNYDAAMRGYEDVVRSLDDQRRLAATAVFRLGECYRKLGRTNDAVAQYQRVIRDFASEATLVRLSQQNLAGFGAAVGTITELLSDPQFRTVVSALEGASRGRPPGDGTSTSLTGPAASASDAPGITELSAALRAIAARQDDPEAQGRTTLAFFPDDGLRRMLLQLPKLRAQLAFFQANPQGTNNSYHRALAADGPEVDLLDLNSPMTSERAEQEVRTQLDHLRRHVDFIVGIQTARLEALQAAGPDDPAVSRTADLIRQAATLESQLATVTQLEDFNRRIAVIKTLFPSEGIQRIQDQGRDNEQQRARLSTQFSDDHPEMRSLMVTAELLDRRLRQEVDDVLSGEQARLESLRATLAKLEAASGSSPNFVTSGSKIGEPATREEEEEIRRIQALVASSPDLVNAATGDGGLTPLQTAASKAQLSVARYLLDHGAKLEAPGADGRLPLHSAALAGHKAMVELLLQRGAPVDAADKDGASPLHYAARNGFLAVAEVLLAQGANPNLVAREKWGMPWPGKAGTPLVAAVVADNLAMARLLIEKGAQPNAQAEKGLPPLSWVRSLPVTRYLLEKGADPNLDGGQRLLQTIVGGSESPVESEILEALLAGGAKPDVEPPDRSGTPLYWAVSRRDRRAAELLVRHGADINRRMANTGFAPLHFAALRLDSDWIAWVLDHGADPNLRVGSPSRPSSTARSLRSTNAEEGWTPLQCTGPGKHSDDRDAAARWAKIRLLLERGADPNLPFSDGSRLVHYLAGWANEEVFGLLRDRKTDFDAKAPGGETPLMIAVAKGNEPAVAFLLAAGVDANAQDELGSTALHCLEGTNPLPIAKRLLASKADPSIKNKLGQTPADRLRSPTASAWSPFGVPKPDPNGLRPITISTPGPNPLLQLLEIGTPAK